MELRQWNELPDRMRTREVRKYYNIIAQRRGWFRAKRVFDVIVSLIMIVFLAIPMAVFAAMIKLDSKGPVFSGSKELRSMEEFLRFTNSELW